MARASGVRVSTTLRRFGSGRNLGGRLSHVLRPITTALWVVRCWRVPVVVVEVTLLKCFRSGGRDAQG